MYNVPYPLLIYTSTHSFSCSHVTMDRPPPTTTELLYEPKERWGHAAVGVDGKVLLWGGYGRSGVGPISASGVVEDFNLGTGRWEQRKTTGTPPRGAIWGAYTTIGNKAYHFGGWDGSSRYNSLRSLDLSTMQWVTLNPTNPSQGPSRKNRCGMVAHGDNKLVVFGGLTEGGRYTDELHVYNLREGQFITFSAYTLRVLLSSEAKEDQWHIVLDSPNPVTILCLLT